MARKGEFVMSGSLVEPSSCDRRLMEKLAIDFPHVRQQRCSIHLKGNIKNRKNGLATFATRMLDSILKVFTEGELNSLLERNETTRGLSVSVARKWGADC